MEGKKEALHIIIPIMGISLMQIKLMCISLYINAEQPGCLRAQQEQLVEKWASIKIQQLLEEKFKELQENFDQMQEYYNLSKRKNNVLLCYTDFIKVLCIARGLFIIKMCT